MNYGQSGNAKSNKNTPRHSEHNARGTAKNPYGAQAGKEQAGKEELLARMKAAAEAKKPE